MNDNKSVPCDNVPIKYLANLIIALILLNKTLCKQGCFFNYIKIAQVIPMFKFGKNDESLQLSFNFFAKSCFQTI